MSKSIKRFTNLKNHIGIRKDNLTGSYVATTRINGHRKTKSFKRLNAAIEWRRQCSPTTIIEESRASITFHEAWTRYFNEYVETLSTSTKEFYRRKESVFLSLRSYAMENITPDVIANFLYKEKEKCILLNHQKRINFDHEIKILCSFFNWYREVIDYKFVSPMLKRHFQIGKVREKVIKNKKMTFEQLTLFFNSLRQDCYWYEFATCQFFLAARVQEIAGLQKSSVSIPTRSLTIKDVAVWGTNKKFVELKPMPKNGEIRQLFLNDVLINIFTRKMDDKTTSFIFHKEGHPHDYREIQYHYNKALKACGLYPEFSGTHFLRHSMATLARKATGSLELTQAMTGHKDQKMVQHYARMDIDSNKEAQLKILDFISTSKSNLAYKSEQPAFALN